MTDGQLDGRMQRWEELSGKCKALSNGVQVDAIDAGPRRVARERGGSSMPNPALQPDRGGRVRVARENNSTTEATCARVCGSWLLNRKS
jgi:hypothetical protein